MRKQVEAWQKSELTDVTEQYQDFRSRTIWSLLNAFIQGAGPDPTI
jgi:hypothetical protein